MKQSWHLMLRVLALCVWWLAFDVAQVDLVVSRLTISRASLRSLIVGVRDARLYHGELQRCLERTEAVSLTDFLVALADHETTQFVLVQLVWSLGRLLDQHVVATFAEEDANIADVRNCRERRQHLAQYVSAMHRMLSGSSQGTSCIDAATTHSKEKRFFMAVGTPGNVLCWAPPQVSRRSLPLSNFALLLQTGLRLVR